MMRNPGLRRAYGLSMASNLRPYIFYDTAVSICASCYRRVDAKIVFQDGAVWMLKRCPQHGPERVMLADDIAYYKRSREIFVKTPEQVAHYNTPVKWGCPYDCGICPDHEQHGCTVLVEITDVCNLRCPTCYAMSGPHRTTHRTLEQVERMLDRAVANEVEPDIVQLSGGEPTLHPQFFEILDAAKKRPINYLMVNTNGVRIAEEPGFAERLADYRGDFELYLQFDSFERQALMTLRAADMRRIHERALAKLNALEIPTTLVVTVRRGVNDHELGKIVEFALEQPCVRGVNFQPVQAAGRLEDYTGGYNTDRDRLTLTEVRRKILRQTDVFAPEDIIPVPCHADSLAMAYALKVGDEVIPLTGLVAPEVLLDTGRNTVLYEREQSVVESVFSLFSTHHSQSSEQRAMGELLEMAGNKIQYDNVFRVLIVEFIDAHAFDLRSIRKTCIHIVHPDAKRVIPFDTYNLLYRDHLEEELLAPIRAERGLLGGPLSLAKREPTEQAAE